MKKLHQELRFCTPCGKQTVHHGNKRSINWLLHICLMFVLIGFITLPFAIIGRALTARVGGKHGLYCATCGNGV